MDEERRLSVKEWFASRQIFSKDKWGYVWHTVIHPVDGFYEIRHRDRGSLAVAIVLVIIFSLCFSINRLSAGFVVNDINPRSVNTFTELISVLLLYFLVAVSNWSITCLMEGEGRMKDILIAVGYSLVPVTIGFIVGTIFSQFVAADESAFYYMIVGIGIAYSVFMLFVGIMNIHNYTLGKTILTMILTLVALLIIIFIALLFIDLIGQVVSFFKSIYQELIFRG